MRYFGGKGVHGKKISEAILKYYEITEDTVYIEPFCGALGVFRYIAPLCKKSYANDICKDIILLWNSVKNKTFKNPKIDNEKWKSLKTEKPSPDRAFAGFGCSFGGVWFNGYISEAANNDMQYSSFEKFDSELFWEVARKLGKQSNITVIISEFSAPKDFKIIHSFKRRSGMHNTSSNNQLVENLYTLT